MGGHSTADPSQDAVRANVRALMARQDRSQAQLAKVLDRSSAWVSRWMRGEIRSAKVGDVERLAHYFDVPVAALLAVTSPVTGGAEDAALGGALTGDEQYIVVSYRRLPPSAQKRVRRLIGELILDADSEEHTRGGHRVVR